jgi:polyhydroxyalkanoate synthesis repressor PhaR
MATSAQPVLIKRYAKSRLYCPGAGRYVSLADLADMVEDDEDFVIRDAASGADITHLVLKQIIIERAGHG